MTNSTDESIGLIGQWRFLHADKRAPDQSGVVITFDKHGGLTYEIMSQEMMQTIKLTYRVENSWLITDQPSSPRVERTRFQITPSGELVLEFEGTKSWYQKI